MKLSRFKIKKLFIYLSILYNHPRPLKNLFGSILMYTGLSKFITIKRDGYKLVFYPSSLSLNFFNNSSARTIDEELVCEFLPKNGTYVDVGANIGSLALKAFSHLEGTGNIVAIEAHPTTYKYLKGNFHLNNFKRVGLYNYAIGEEYGEAFFSDINADDQNAISKQKTSVKVKVVPLDSLTEDFDLIDLLKIDVEGFELQVLKGGSNSLKKTKTCLIEIGEENFNKFGYSTPDLISFMEKLGFECFSCENNMAHIGTNYIPQKIENIICKRV